jgi:pectate lyase
VTGLSLLHAGEFEPPVDKGPVEEPSRYYPYTLDSASSIPAIVQAGAGTGKI